MGKTNPTYRDQLRSTERDWDQFERALRRRDQPAYEELWEHAHSYADAAGMKFPARTMDGVLLSVALGQQREINDLREELEELRNE